jgi:hypothetical protein
LRFKIGEFGRSTDLPAPVTVPGINGIDGQLGEPFGVGVVLNATFTLLFRRIGLFASLAVMAFVPAIAGLYVLPNFDLFDLEVTFYLNGIVEGLLPYICSSLLAAVVTTVVVMDLENQPVSIGKVFAIGLWRLLPVMLISLVIGVVSGLGVIFFVVPGLWAMTVLWVAIPVVVVERAGLLASLRRSIDLTGGCRWSVFAILVIFLVVTLVFKGTMELVILPSFDYGGSLETTLLVSLLAELPIYTLWPIGAAYGYTHLKVRKEGPDAVSLARIFD